MALTYSLSDIADDTVRKKIAAPLIQFNESKVGPANNVPLIITVAEGGEVLGGLWGFTAFGWLTVQLLVVPQAERGGGVGTRLMEMAEREALRRGCHGAWLDTHEFQARGFYERIGYTCFAELPDFPQGYKRFFMQKSLIGRQAENVSGG